MKKFILNTNTGVLHYKDYCTHTKGIVKDDDTYKCFKTENDARKENSISVRWCKICANKREREQEK